MGVTNARPKLAGMAYPSPEPTWQQPNFNSATPPPQPPSALPPLGWVMIQQSSPRLDRLRLARRLLWPIAIVALITTGNPGWLLVAFITSQVLKHQARQEWQQLAMAAQPNQLGYSPTLDLR